MRRSSRSPSPDLTARPAGRIHVPLERRRLAATGLVRFRTRGPLRNRPGLFFQPALREAPPSGMSAPDCPAVLCVGGRCSFWAGLFVSRAIRMRRPWSGQRRQATNCCCRRRRQAPCRVDAFLCSRRGPSCICTWANEQTAGESRTGRQHRSRLAIYVELQSLQASCPRWPSFPRTSKPPGPRSFHSAAALCNRAQCTGYRRLPDAARQGGQWAWSS